MVRKAKAPIFEMYTIDELSKRFQMSKRYLCDVEEGYKPMGKRFRVTACAVLGRTEEELFGPVPDGVQEEADATQH